jgi:hypothetical protein
MIRLTRAMGKKVVPGVRSALTVVGVGESALSIVELCFLDFGSSNCYKIKKIGKIKKIADDAIQWFS